MSRIVERNETVMEKIVNTEEKLCQKWMFRNLLVLYDIPVPGGSGKAPLPGIENYVEST